MAQAPTQKTTVTQPEGVFDVSGGVGGGIVGGPFDNTFSKSTTAPVSTGNLTEKSNPLSNMSPRGDVPTPPPTRTIWSNPAEAEAALIAAFTPPTQTVSGFGGTQFQVKGSLTEAQLRAIRQASALVPTLAKNQSSGDIASSSQMVTDKRRQEAERSAINAIQPSTEQVNPDQAYFDFMRDNMFQSAESAMDLAQQIGERTMESLNLRYDVALAENNAFYADAIQSLQKEAERAQGVADQLYSSLNPYSNSTQASGAKTYTENIRQTYIGKEQKLRQEAKRAEQAIQANDREALNEAMSAMQIAISDANSELNASLRGLQSEAFQTNIKRESMAQDEFQFEKTLSNTENNQAANNFRTLLESGAVPESVAEIDRMIADGSIVEHPVFSAGISIYEQEGIIQAMKAAAGSKETDRKFDAAELQLRMNSAAQSRERLTAEERAFEARSNYQMAKEQYAAQGGDPLTMKGMIETGKYTFGGTKLKETTSRATTQVLSVLSQLDGLSKDVDVLDKDSEVKKLWNKWVGSPNADNFNALQQRINALNPVVARGVLNEVGALSTYDQNIAASIVGGEVGKIGRVGSADSLRSGIALLAEIIVENSVANLNAAANNGDDISSYVFDFERYQQKLEDIKKLDPRLNKNSSQGQTQSWLEQQGL